MVMVTLLIKEQRNMHGPEPDAARDNSSLCQLGAEMHSVKRCVWSSSSTSDFETLIMKSIIISFIKFTVKLKRHRFGVSQFTSTDNFSYPGLLSKTEVTRKAGFEDLMEPWLSYSPSPLHCHFNKGSRRIMK